MPLPTVSIGFVTGLHPVFLAPMAGVTDLSYRLLCKGYGCGLTYSEMISAKSIVYGNARTRELIETRPEEEPWAVQFFGREPDVLAEAIRRLEAWPFAIVDINMGCPAPKIVKNGEGCALMNEPLLAGQMVEAAVRASRRPVTVKMRKGFSHGHANAVEIARIAQASGAAAVAVHGRTRDQFYAGSADWDCIAAVKQAVRIPVIGNGDIFAPEDAVRMFVSTGCDAVMVARGAMGNPWLFARTAAYLQTGVLPPPPDLAERAAVALSHLKEAVAHKGERVAVPEMRKHLSWYTKGWPDASARRRAINAAATAEEMAALLAADAAAY